MKLTTTHYHMVLLLVSALVVSSIGVAYFHIQQQNDLVTKASNEPLAQINKAAGTLLSVRANESSGCDHSLELLSEDQMSALPQHELTTQHTWSEEAETFRGPLLEDVLALVCKDPKHIELHALNDYKVAVDFQQVKQYKPIVAHSVNGERLAIRDKGPLWVMLDHEKYNIQQMNLEGMLVWQLSDIIILSTNEKH